MASLEILTRIKLFLNTVHSPLGCKWEISKRKRGDLMLYVVGPTLSYRSVDSFHLNLNEEPGEIFKNNLMNNFSIEAKKFGFTKEIIEEFPKFIEIEDHKYFTKEIIEEFPKFIEIEDHIEDHKYVCLYIIHNERFIDKLDNLSKRWWEERRYERQAAEFINLEKNHTTENENLHPLFRIGPLLNIISDYLRPSDSPEIDLIKNGKLVEFKNRPNKFYIQYSSLDSCNNAKKVIEDILGPNDKTSSETGKICDINYRQSAVPNMIEVKNSVLKLYKS